MTVTKGMKVCDRKSKRGREVKRTTDTEKRGISTCKEEKKKEEWHENSVSFLAFDDVRVDLYAFPFTFLTCCQVYFDI